MMRFKESGVTIKWWVPVLTCILLLTSNGPVFAMVNDTDQRQRLELDLQIARAAFEAAPDREESYIWLGRRYGYLGRNHEAIRVFSEGLDKFPDSYKLLRFRARHLARDRKFESAIADYKLGLEKMKGYADSFEPNGIPNALDLPTSTYRQNLHYYLGQTSFAVGDYHQMFDELEKSKKTLIDLPFDDHLIAVIYWQYIALQKLDKEHEAGALVTSIPQSPRLLENQAYYEALLVLTGLAPEPESMDKNQLATFALAMKLVFEGNADTPKELLLRLANHTTSGFWPAEAELVHSYGSEVN